MSLTFREVFSREAGLVTFALREAFISLIPYLILKSTAILLLQALHLWSNSADLIKLDIGMTLLPDALPILVLLTFSSQLAKLKNIDSVGAMLLSITLLLTVYPLILVTNQDNFQSGIFSIFALLIPIFSTYIFAKALDSKWLPSPQEAPLVDSVRMIYRYTPAFIVSYLLGLVILELIYALLFPLSKLEFIAIHQLANNTEWFIVVRTFFTHILTFTGVHGTNLFDLLVNQDYLNSFLAPNLTAKNLIDTFVLFGGVGAGLSLAMTILIVAKDRHAIKISKIAFPFLVFNITEILLYGLPIVLNRRLLLPFIFVPMCNLALTLLAVNMHLFTFTTTQLPWTTPIFFSGYFSTGGDWCAVLFQAFLIAFDICIYTFFVRAYVNTQSTATHFSLLKEKLNISEGIQAKQGLKFQEAQSFLVNAHLDIHHIIDLIIKNELVMFYQPIIDIKNQRCHHFEALLRLKMQDGKINAPYFIPILERAGLSTVIDIWVCQQVRSALEAWHEEGYHPSISINLHPDTLIDGVSMHKVLSLLSGFDVQFEVIERAFLIHEETAANIQLLQDSNFKLAIDDFGTGYSSLEHLHNSSADTIKLDKILIDITNTEAGYKIYAHSSRMCIDLGFRLIAEGVETEAQLNVVKEVGIQFVQGWYFSCALPSHEAKAYALGFNEKHQSN